jgi:hypothetical protein
MQLRKLYLKTIHAPQNVRFADLCRLATAFGHSLDRVSGSRGGVKKGNHDEIRWRKMLRGGQRSRINHLSFATLKNFSLA